MVSTCLSLKLLSLTNLRETKDSNKQLHIHTHREREKKETRGGVGERERVRESRKEQQREQGRTGIHRERKREEKEGKRSDPFKCMHERKKERKKEKRGERRDISQDCLWLFSVFLGSFVRVDDVLAFHKNEAVFLFLVLLRIVGRNAEGQLLAFVSRRVVIPQEPF
jgi:hypothetical protein